MRSAAGMLTQEGWGGLPGPLAARLHRIPTHFILYLHGVAWKLPYLHLAPLAERELSPQVRSVYSGGWANDSAIYSPDMLVSAPACTRCTMDHATRVVLWPNPLDSHRHQREGGFHPLLQVSPGR